MIMKTKKIFTTAVFLIAFATSGIAQNGLFEARVDIGYGTTSGPQSVTNVSGSTSTDVPYSMGMGFNAALSASYFFGDHIGAGLDINYVVGTPTTVTSGGTIQYTSTLQGSLATVTPFLVLSAHPGGINPYGRFGIVLGVPQATISTTAAGPLAPSGTNIDEASGNLAIGLYGAFGVEFPLSGNLALDVELFDRSLQWEPGQVENTQAYDGESKAKTITYSHSVTSPSGDNQVSSYSTLYSPFSSFGIKVGLTMKFGQM